jgi:tripartite-type tricarboxylate transporter receptor subunit TctC
MGALRALGDAAGEDMPAGEIGGATLDLRMRPFSGERFGGLSFHAGLGGQVGQALRPLAQTGATRSQRFPDLPTVAEAGIAGVDALAWWGALAPARTPEPILRRFHAALRSALETPEVRGRMADPLGIDLVASTPEEFAAFLDRQMETWGRVVRENNIRPD